MPEMQEEALLTTSWLRSAESEPSTSGEDEYFYPLFIECYFALLRQVEGMQADVGI